MEISERELIALCQKGDVEAFEKLVLKYEKQIYTIAYRFMGNHEDACDLAQEALVKAYKYISQFRGEASIKTWLYHIVANVCRDELRKRKRQTTVSLDSPIVNDEGGELLRQTEDWTYAPELIYENKELQELIQKALDHLTPEYKEVLIMREIMGFTYDEIAKELDCSLGTVKSRISRARKAMRNYMLARREQFKETLRLSK